MKAVVLTFDRLPLSFLGCYGHSRVATPHFDRLAAHSVVFDQHFAENVDPAAADHAWNTGCFHFPRSAEHTNPKRQREAVADHTNPKRKRGNVDVSGPPHVAGILAQAGIAGTLIRETQSNTPLAGFQRVLSVDGEHGLAAALDRTPIARLMARAETVLSDWQTGGGVHRLLWLHSHGVPSPWCPPRQFARAALARHSDEPEDVPPLPDEPDSEAAGADDLIDDAGEEVLLEDLPDGDFDEFVGALVEAAASERGGPELSFEEWQAARAVLAGYVEMIDAQLGRLLSALQRLPADEPLLLIVAAAAGAAAGERLLLSLPATPLAEEIVHTPLLLRLADGEPGTRRQNLVQTVDLVPTLLDWFQVQSPASAREGRSLLPLPRQTDGRERDFLCLGDGAQTAAIRTADRYLVHWNGAERPLRLFVKPDDIWEANEVSAQSPAEVDWLEQALEQFIQQARTAAPCTPLPLPERPD